MLTCDQALEYMSQALDGPLSLEKRRELDEHLASCPQCRTDYEALFQLEDVLRDMGETSAPAELSTRVMEQIREESQNAPRPIPLGRRARWRHLAGLAACAALCVGLYYGMNPGGLGAAPEAAALTVEAAGEAVPYSGISDTEPSPETEDAGGAADAAPAPSDRSADSSQSGGEAGQTKPAGVETRRTPSQSDASQAEDGTGGPAQGETPAPRGSTQADSTPPESGLLTAPQPEADTPSVNAALAVPPWGEGTALVLRSLPQEAEALLPPEEEWIQETGARWCAVTAGELEQLQEVLEQAGVEADLPPQPWTEPCAVVLLEEAPAAGGEENAD